MINIASLSINQEEMNPYDEMNMIVTGQLSRDKNGTYYLEYTETDPESTDTTIVNLELTAQGVNMKRQGAASAYMMFENNKAFTSCYETEYGRFDLEIYTLNASWNVEDNHGVIRLKYQISTDGSYPWIQSLTIRFADND